MAHITFGGTLTFWTLAIIPGLLHPFLLFAYFLRFGRRKKMIDSVLRLSAEHSNRPAVRQEGAKQMRNWQGKL